jgi:hypothetical protein
MYKCLEADRTPSTFTLLLPWLPGYERTAAYFYIISKDTGFDPLIKHLNGKNYEWVECRRLEQFRSLSLQIQSLHLIGSR